MAAAAAFIKSFGAKTTKKLRCAGFVKIIGAAQDGRIDRGIG